MSDKKFFQETQGILSLGYIYLVILGIINETLTFYPSGVNIIKYSSVLDVLISPISQITAKPLGLIFFLVLILCLLFLPSYFSNKGYRKWYKSAFGIKSDVGKKENQTHISNMMIVWILFGSFGFFIGTGISSGQKMKEKLEDKKIEFNDVLNFTSGVKDEVEIVGKNSIYLFYITPESKSVVVSPISVLQSVEEIK